MRAYRQALTLVELLVGLALTSIILIAMVSFFTSSSKASMQSTTRANLQQETLNAQQLIVGKLKESWFVYPAGVKLTMTTSSLTKKPTGGSNANQWTIGTDPILAMILPPKNPGAACNTSGSTAVDGCYRFLAYYAVRRSDWLSGVGTDTSKNPGVDPVNDDKWVLAEYRANFPTSAISTTLSPTYPPNPVPTPPTSNVPNILADYISPANTLGSPYTMFTLKDIDGNSPSLTNPVKSVVMNLAVARTTAGKVIRLPNDTGTYVTTVAPSNLGKVAAQ